MTSAEQIFPAADEIRLNLSDAAVSITLSPQATSVSLRWATSCEGRPPACDPGARSLQAVIDGDALTIADAPGGGQGDVRPQMKIHMTAPSNCDLRVGMEAGVFNLAGELTANSDINIQSGALEADAGAQSSD